MNILTIMGSLAKSIFSIIIGFLAGSLSCFIYIIAGTYFFRNIFINNNYDSYSELVTIFATNPLILAYMFIFSVVANFTSGYLTAKIANRLFIFHSIVVGLIFNAVLVLNSPILVQKHFFVAVALFFTGLCASFLGGKIFNDRQQRQTV